MPRPQSSIRSAFRVGSRLALVAGAVLAAGSAHAQSASSTLSSYRTGYGGAGVSGLESPVNLSLVSSASQFTVSDGVNQAGSVGSVFTAQTSSGQASTSQTSGGAGQSYSGVGQATSNARAPLTVVDRTKPDGSTPSPPALAAASSTAAAPTAANAPNEIVLNGQLNLDGGQ